MLWSWAGCSRWQMVKAEKGRRVIHWLSEDMGRTQTAGFIGLQMASKGSSWVSTSLVHIKYSSILLWWLYHFQGNIHHIATTKQIRLLYWHHTVPNDTSIYANTLISLLTTCYADIYFTRFLMWPVCLVSYRINIKHQYGKFWMWLTWKLWLLEIWMTFCCHIPVCVLVEFFHSSVCWPSGVRTRTWSSPCVAPA